MTNKMKTNPILALAAFFTVDAFVGCPGSVQFPYKYDDLPTAKPNPST
jgi:hypothetical protein